MEKKDILDLAYLNNRKMKICNTFSTFLKFSEKPFKKLNYCHLFPIWNKREVAERISTRSYESVVSANIWYKTFLCASIYNAHEIQFFVLINPSNITFCSKHTEHRDRNGEC